MICDGQQPKVPSRVLERSRIILEHIAGVNDVQLSRWAQRVSHFNIPVHTLLLMTTRANKIQRKVRYQRSLQAEEIPQDTAGLTAFDAVDTNRRGRPRKPVTDAVSQSIPSLPQPAAPGFNVIGM